SSRRRLGTALTLGYAVPGTALAIGVLVAYGPWLSGSAAIILLAYLGKCAALGYRALAAGADRVAPELGQAARVSGADPATVYRTITAPVMSTGYLAAAGLVVLFAVHELTMSSILYGPDTQTFAVVVLNQQQLGDVGTSAALALILTLPPLIVVGAGSGAIRARGANARRRRRDARPPPPLWGSVAQP
ncbi:MAG: ABC transporter permease subunit, partial [Pedococcus sp.]